MMKKVSIALTLLMVVIFAGYSQKIVSPPKPYGVLPSEQQLNWQQLEEICIVHFGLNTFTDKEWGYGNVSPEKFNPTDFDPNQIVSAAKSAGIKGLVFVAKHHDGFCLWPSKATDYNISKSNWKDGKDNVVKLLKKPVKNRAAIWNLLFSLG